MANFLQGEIKLGKVKVPKAGVVLGGAVALGILGYAYYNRANSAGYVDGTGEEIAGDDLGYSDESEFGYGVSGQYIYDPASGGIIGTGYGGGKQVITDVSTNAAWAQAAILLMRQYGYEATLVTDAIGKALNGSPMTQDELNVFNAALALQGQPPQGYPPINLSNAKPPTGGNDNEPPPSNNGATPGASLPAIQQLRVSERSATTIRIEWGAIPAGSKAVAVFANGKRYGTVYGHGFRLRGLKRNTRYSISIRPVGSDHGLGKAATVSGTTTK